MSFDVSLSLSHPNIDVVTNFVSLATAASASIAPPIAIVGLTYIFLKRLSTTVMENMYVIRPIFMIRRVLMTGRPEAQRLLIGYTVDLINVLIKLFSFTLRPTWALTTGWEELREVFETDQHSDSRQDIHSIICSKVRQVNRS